MFKDFYLKVKLEENGIIPTRINSTDAGLDFYSPNYFEILPNSDILIPLQVRIEFSSGYVMIFKEKSSIALKKKLSIGACIIDSEYRGIIHAHFFNHSNKLVIILKNENIIQGLVFPIWTGQPELVKQLNLNTIRGEGGFGSTLIKNQCQCKNNKKFCNKN